MSLHRGKLDRKLEIMVTEEFSDVLGAAAHELNISKSELGRELLYLAYTGETYSFHQAKDKDIDTKLLLEKVRNKFRNDSGQL